MPRRIPDFPTAWVGWNGVISAGVILSVMGGVLFINVLGATNPWPHRSAECVPARSGWSEKDRNGVGLACLLDAIAEVKSGQNRRGALHRRVLGGKGVVSRRNRMPISPA